MERRRHDTLWGFEDWLYDDGRILIKRICADTRLSVQVHPNDDTAKTVGGRAKTEMWCVLKEGPIFAGFKPGVTEADVVRAVEDGSFESLLVRFDAKHELYSSHDEVLGDYVNQIIDFMSEE